MTIVIKQNLNSSKITSDKFTIKRNENVIEKSLSNVYISRLPSFFKNVEVKSNESSFNFNPNLIQIATNISTDGIAQIETQNTANVPIVNIFSSSEDATNIFPGFLSDSFLEKELFFGTGPEMGLVTINNSFGFTQLGKLLENSRKSLEDTNIRVLSHELIKTNRVDEQISDCNLLFLDARSQANKTLLSLRESEIEKKECLSDRFFLYINILQHNDLIQKCYNDAIVLVNKVDQTSMLGNKLENEINYGNIVDNFIKEGKSAFIGKISNQILTNNKNLSTLIGGNDEVLLDSQERVEKSKISKDNLEIFYKNISGFDYKEKSLRFSNSISNYRITNTDRIVGQFMSNYSVGHNSIYPNSDNVESLEFYSSTIRKKINGSALNRYPIIQFKDINLNSRIFSNTKLDFLAVSGDTLNTSRVLRNVSSELKDKTYLPNIVNKSSFLFSSSDIVNLQSKYNEGDDINTGGTSYLNRRSLAGKKNSDASRSSSFDNNIVSLYLKSNPPGRSSWGRLNSIGRRRRSQNIKPILFERLFIDVDARKYDNYLVPSFLMLPTRWIVGRSSTSISDMSKQEIHDNIRQTMFRGLALNEGINAGNDNNVDLDLLIENSKLNFLNMTSNLYFKVSRNKNNRDFSLSNNRENLILIDTEHLSEAYLESYIVNSFRNDFDNLLRLPEPDGISRAINREFGDRIESAYESDITKLGNTFYNESQSLEETNLKIKNDCFVFNTSNNMIKTSQISDLSVLKNSSLSFEERFVNKDNTSENASSVFKRENSASKISVLVSNAINLIRKNLTSNKTFSKFFSKIKSKVVQQEDFALLYDKYKENCIDTFEESPFITEEGFYVNNFTERFSLKAENTTKLFIDDDLDIKDNKLFSSKTFREYVSEIHTKSFLRNKSALYNRILKDNVDIFKNNSEYESRSFFGFDTLMAESFVDSSKSSANDLKELCKLILTNSIIRSAGIESQVSAIYERPQNNVGIVNKETIINKKISDNLRKIFGDQEIDQVISLVFNKENIKKKKNKVLRSVHKNRLKNFKDLNLTSSSAQNGLRIDFIDGNMAELCFPGIHVVNSFGKRSLSNKSVSSNSIPNFYFIRNQLPQVRGNYNQDNLDIIKIAHTLNQAVSNMSYNYDVFLNEDETGVICYERNEENNVFVNNGFNFDKDTQNRGIDLRLTYMLYKFVTFDEVAEANNIKIPYESRDIIVPMSYFYLSTKQNTFSQKITSICTDLLTVFDTKYDNINNIDEALSFVDDNSHLPRILEEIIKCFAEVFLQSCENYNTFIEEKIRLESINKDMSESQFSRVVEKYNFINGTLRDKAFCVSDIESILKRNEENIDVPEYEKDDIQIFNSPVDYDREIIYSKRFFELQIANKILKNSDISEALCLDILHGYFLNLESNKKLESDSKEELKENIAFINDKINSIDVVKNVDIKDYIFDEFYQNKLSKNIQEIMFYKNIFNENFTRNNFYSSNEQKYKNENMFNHRRLYYLNSYNKAVQSLKLLEKSSKDNASSNLDILKIPVSYKIANKIGTRGFLKVEIQPVNLKFPEIEYEKIIKYYTPMLSGLTSNYMSSLPSSFFNFCGIYNDTQKISERYSIATRDIVLTEVRNLLLDIFALKAEEEQIAFNEDVRAISELVYEDVIKSSAVSNLDFVTQLPINDSVKIQGLDIDNLVSRETLNLIRSINTADIAKIFDNFDTSIIQDNYIDEASDYKKMCSNKEVLEKDMFYKKFIKDLDRDISQQDLISALVPSNLYDIFNIVIDRNSLKLDSDISRNILSNMGLDLFNSPTSINSKNLCFSYYINFEVL